MSKYVWWCRETKAFCKIVLTVLSFGYKASENLSLTVGANKLLDVSTDRDAEVLPDGGADGSSCRFDWSRRVSQFGNN